ncbi:DUF4167 domain-containing protein [Ciceribacter ferrooxidans]|uniref:DUF4167 domain-containing protein n=1 Tax=Ciceribacter ferrooxidans TaxID=2509717 RepID=A0A4V1RR69_9HYPH|nr:DUF4167 domain-containing protein [Ciceribacter ferrooxidans]RYC15318.1 DUF4167 domain-containing protein [Ciceribacter ferrooxidans]
MSKRQTRGPRQKSPSNNRARGGSRGGARGPANSPKAAMDRYEHYLALAQETARSGDRIEAENYYQHAEHYYRSAAAIAAAAAEKTPHA